MGKRIIIAKDYLAKFKVSPSCVLSLPLWHRWNVISLNLPSVIPWNSVVKYLRYRKNNIPCRPPFLFQAFFHPSCVWSQGHRHGFILTVPYSDSIGIQEGFMDWTDTVQICVDGCSPSLATTRDLPSRPLAPEHQGPRITCTGKFAFLASSQGCSCCCSDCTWRTIALRQSF